jgi:transmembrane sensor
MNNDPDIFDDREANLRSAIARFARRQSGEFANDVSAADEEETVIERELESMWEELEPLRFDPSVLEFRQAALRDGWLRRLPWHGLAAACAAVLVAMVALWLGGAISLAPKPAEERFIHFASPAGQRSQLALADGSTVVLDVASAIDVSFGKDRRRIELRNGRAYFRVQPDALRPFVVSHGGKSVTAIGTEFAVDTTPRGVEVILTKGRVRVAGRSSSGDEQAVEMTSGYRLLAVGEADWRLSRADTSTLTAWIRGQLIFSEWTLGEIAKEMNRYSTRQVVIDDPQVAEERMSGVLNLGDIDTFVAAVEAQDIGRVARSSNKIVHLGKKSAFPLEGEPLS